MAAAAMGQPVAVGQPTMVLAAPMAHAVATPVDGQTGNALTVIGVPVAGTSGDPNQAAPKEGLEMSVKH